MTAKEYLLQIADIQGRIYDNESKVKQLMERATSITATDYSKDVVKSSGEPYAKFETLIDSISDLQKKIIRQNVQLTLLDDEICDKVNGIKNNNERAVLYKRYILMKSWSEIATEMHYSIRHVTRLHGEALHTFSVQYGFPKNDAADDDNNDNVLVCPIEKC